MIRWRNCSISLRVVRGEFLHLRFVVGFGFGQMSADFFDLRYWYCSSVCWPDGW